MSKMFKLVLFDMDDTLYPRSTGLMTQITQRITQYMIDHIGLTPDEAAHMRQRFRQRYGTALRGLMEEQFLPNPASVDAYLHYVHDIALDGVLSPDPAARAMLLRLPLRRGVLTSSHSEHAERVLNAMQLRDVFEHVIDIRAVNFINKPHRGAYETALARFGVHASETIFVEDTDVNTRPAKAMGMTTILIDHPPTNGADFVVPDLMAAGQVVQQLLDYSTRDNNANTGANTGANT